RPLGEKFIADRRRLRRELPSWGELSEARASLLLELAPQSESKNALPDLLAAWLEDLRLELENAGAESKAYLGRANRLAQLSEDFAASMDMRPLYDSDRRLFAIGQQA